MSFVVLEVMPWLGIRDPFSMLSHLLGTVLSLVALALLLQRAQREGRDRWALVGLTVYGLSMALAFAASTVFHTLIRPPEQLVLLKKLDHAAIFLVVAGTGTAMYSALSIRRLVKAVAIVGVWSISLAALAVKMMIWPMPLWLTSLVYLAVGWVATAGFFMAMRAVGWRRLQVFLWGAVVLTLGTVVFATEWPILWTGIIEGHEVFHVLVLVGVGLHFQFVYTYCTIPKAFAPLALDPVAHLGLAAVQARAVKGE